MTALVAVDQRLADRLPTRSRLKLGRLVAQARASEAVFQAAVRRSEELREQIGAIQAERATLLAQAAELGIDKPDVSEADHAIAQLQTELARLDAHRDKRGQARHDAAQLVARLRHFLEQLPPTPALARAQINPPRLINGETPPQAVARLRAEITKVQRELAALASAPLPSGELRERARQWVAELARAGRPMLRTAQGRFEIEWHAGAFGGPMAPASIAILAAINPDGLYALIDEQITATNSGSGLASGERPKKEAQLRARLHDLEAQEESIIDHEDDAADGVAIPRRPEADPWAVLAVRHSLAERKAS
jgi:uncharacterized small protein (DUF1192 family)